MAPKRVVSLNAVNAGLSTEQGRQMSQLRACQKAYVLNCIEKDPELYLPILVAALDSQRKKPLNSGWFVRSCRQYKDIKGDRCLEIMQHIEPDFQLQHDTSIPLMSLRLMLCRCLGVRLSFRIPRTKRHEEDFLAWAKIQYVAQGCPLKNWPGWQDDFTHFGPQLIYSLLRPTIRSRCGQTKITHVKLNRTGQVAAIHLDSLCLDNVSEWIWTDADCEERCKLENFVCGDSKWLGKLFKGSTIQLDEHPDDDNDDDCPGGEVDPTAVVVDKSEGTFFEQLRVPPPPKKGPNKSAAARAKLLSVGPPSKRPRTEPEEESNSVLALEDEHEADNPCPLQSLYGHLEPSTKTNRGNKSKIMALHFGLKIEPLEALVG